MSGTMGDERPRIRSAQGPKGLAWLRRAVTWPFTARAGRRQLEEALRRIEARYRTLTENVHDLIVEIGNDGRVLYVTPNLPEILGYDPVEYVGRNIFEGVHPEDLETARRIFETTIASGGLARVELRYRHQDGSWRWLEAKGRAFQGSDGTMRGVLIASDVTDRVRAEDERRRLEAQVLRAEKLESLGLLAGGIAHDFNNLLTSILGNVDLVARSLDTGSPARARVDHIREASLHAVELTKHLLAYAGRGQVTIGPVDLSELTESMVHLLKVSISEPAVLRWELGENLPAIEGDAGQISQVVLNLIINASDALSERGGTIRVRTGVREVDRAYLSKAYLPEELDEGRYVYLEVTDTGAGMDQDTASKIFDPFFTTKSRGRGLGLAAVLGIVRAHSGAMRVETELGRGTTFLVLFPSQDLHGRHSVANPEHPRGAAR